MRNGRKRWGVARQVVVGLVALSSAACTTVKSEQEPDKGNTQGGALAERCEVRPPFVPNFEPELDWQWTGSPVLPDHKQVMMTPAVVDVNGDGIPDIVFGTFAGANYNVDGVLRAISGDDGHELWTVTDVAHRIKAAASIAAGDIDGDGQVEVCAIPENGRGVICFENDGTFKFRTPEGANDYNEWGGPSLADLDGNGIVEILDGNRVYSNTGALKWVGSDGMGGAKYTGPVSFGADIDQDGKQEVVNGRSIYRHDGTLLCANPAVPHGFASVANFDADAKGEIVVSGREMVSLMDDDCTVLWSIPVPGGGHGGSPNIADFDGDGTLEIGVAGDYAYTVLEADGTTQWTAVTHDYSSGKTNSTTFDFESDGKPEVVYADETMLRIYDGATGVVRWQVKHGSGTTHEGPLVVDVDADDRADIVVVSNNHAYPGTNGIRVFHDRLEGWMPTRRIWNQHAYSVTNVNDDGTIPSHPLSNWLVEGLNTFRSNPAGYSPRPGPSPYAAADVLVSEVGVDCNTTTGSLSIAATVENIGEAAAPMGTPVAFYQGNPASGGTLLGVVTLGANLPAGGSTAVTLSLSAPSAGNTVVYVVVDDDGAGGHQVTECREDNNLSSAEAYLSCSADNGNPDGGSGEPDGGSGEPDGGSGEPDGGSGTPDGGSGGPSNLPPVALCRNVTVSADALCQGNASVDNGSHDPDNGPAPLSVSETPGGPFSLGSHDVLLTASDGEASAVCMGTVTVVDTTAPVISCPASQEALECTGNGAVATYEASATDNCSEAPTTCSVASGSVFPVGETPVTCSATDASGNASSCGFAITVRDTLPPVSGGELGAELWPPNHTYRTITLAECAQAGQDQCSGPLPVETYGRILRVTSDEVEDANGNGDGRTCNDMKVFVNTTTVELRSEREGGGDGRVYTIHYELDDPAGNTTTGSCRVSVPHDQSGDVAVDSGAKFCVGEGCPANEGGSPLCN